MRILHVIESLDFGGAEKVVVDLTRALLVHGEVDICCVKHEGKLALQLDPRIHVYCLHKGEGNDWRVPIRLARLIRDHGYDVVHSHSWGVYLESALAAMLARVPRLVHTVHGHYLSYPPGLVARLKKRLRHILERLLAYRYDRIVTVSDSIQAYVRRDIGLPVGRMVTIRNGVPCVDSRRSPSTRAAVTFMTVGRLAGVKNHAMMLRAFAITVRTQPGARLRIVGDGPERKNLEAQAHALGISQHVEFLGFRNDVSPLLAEADVLLMSSHYEGVSIAILEAMCAGLPVIATRVGGVPETVQDGVTGLLVADNDADAMAQVMLGLIASEPERRRLGEGGQARLQQEFSIGIVAGRYYQIYRGQN
jgi:glycosyltransferase involved in cell wall biosynthesis